MGGTAQPLTLNCNRSPLFPAGGREGLRIRVVESTHFGPLIGDGSPVSQTFWIDDLAVSSERPADTLILPPIRGSYNDRSSALTPRSLRSHVWHRFGEHPNAPTEKELERCPPSPTRWIPSRYRYGRGAVQRVPHGEQRPRTRASPHASGQMH